jgi:hypothetical protein
MKTVTLRASKCIQKTGIVNRKLKPAAVLTYTRINTLALPTLLYGCETWVIREEDKSRITSAEMRFCEENGIIHIARFQNQ